MTSLFCRVAVAATLLLAASRLAEADGDIGVNFKPDNMILYELDEEHGHMPDTLVIGFSTWLKRGILMQIKNDDANNPEYISIEMNNNGGIKVELDVGFDRDVINTAIRDIDLADGQPHVAVVNIMNNGRLVRVSVDDYPPVARDWSWLSDSADTTLDNPRYVYFGRNESMSNGQGFFGCLYRAKFGDLDLLTEVFQQPLPDHLTVRPEGAHMGRNIGCSDIDWEWSDESGMK